jgi:hypothetical protein
MCSVVYLDHYSLLNILLVYVKEIEILGRGKDLNFFERRDESIEVRIFAL